MIEKLNVIDAIIGLPANLFFGTGIPVCVLVLRKDRNNNADNILFIDASKDFEPGKNQNQLKEEHINRIVETYTNRMEIEGYSHKAVFSEIIENGWNLNIPRYVDSSEKEPEINISDVMMEISGLKKRSEELENRMKAYLKELGL